MTLGSRRHSGKRQRRRRHKKNAARVGARRVDRGGIADKNDGTFIQSGSKPHSDAGHVAGEIVVTVITVS